MKNKDKNLLIIQNKELLERLNKGNNNKEQSNDIDGNENYLLKEEIKSLKEQIENVGVSTFQMGKKGLAYVRRIEL